ncbi:MAG: metallophosphoesterase [Victivallales bacterium]|nr:metallophosphoesterase [Victivallales bacterium]
MELKIAAISDMHYTPEPKVQVPKRYGNHSLAFVDAAIRRIDDDIRPDILLVAGDLVDLPEQEELLKEIAPHILKAKSPMIVIPGNHDPAPEIFYRYLPEPPPYVDINGHRIAIFPNDKGANGFKATREPKEEFRFGPDDGTPVIMFQHVPIALDGETSNTHTYENAEGIIANALSHNAVFSIAAHFHGGQPPYFGCRLPNLMIPSLTEAPCSFVSFTFRDAKLVDFTYHYTNLEEIIK